jgi:hypothetical protein
MVPQEVLWNIKSNEIDLLIDIKKKKKSENNEFCFVNFELKIYHENNEVYL